MLTNYTDRAEDKFYYASYIHKMEIYTRWGIFLFSKYSSTGYWPYYI